MAELLRDPCETLANWSPFGTPTYSIPNPAGRNGLALGITSSDASGGLKYTIASVSESATLTFGCAFRIGSLINNFAIQFRSDTGTTAHFTVGPGNDGNLYALRGGSGGTILQGTSGAPIAAGAWNYLEVQAVLSDTVGAYVVKLNGTTVLSGTNVDTKNGGTKTVFDSVVLYSNGTTVTNYDDIYIRNDNTFEGDPGDLRAVSGTGTGAIVFAGAGTATTGSATVSGAGAMVFAGTGVAVAGKYTGTGTGAIVFAGVGLASTGPSATSGVGPIVFAGVGRATTAPSVGTGTGAIVFAGVGAAVLSPNAVTGTGAVVFAGAGVAVVSATAVHGSGAVVFNGRANVDVAPHLDVYAPPEWSWQLIDPSSGDHVGPLTVAAARKLTFELDGAATATFTMPSEHPETAAVVELATDVVVARNGRPLFRGRVNASTETHSATEDSVNFTATDYRGILDHRLFWSTSTLEFAGVDQADIAWQLLADTQALPGGDLHVTRGVGAVTGVVRDRTFTAGSGVGQALKELAGVAGGFDWDIDPSLAFNLYHPQRGRNTGLVLAYGRDVLKATATVNPAEYANAVYYTGATPQTTPAEVTVSTFPPDVGRWDLQKSDPNVVLQATLDQQAAGALATDSQLISALTVTLAPDTWNPYLLWLGDTVRLLVQAGRLNVDVTRRVVKIQVDLDDTGTETVVLDIGTAPTRLSDRLNNLADRLSALELAPGIGDANNYGGIDGSGDGTGGGGGGGIQEITSSDGSIVVTNPTGPVTDLAIAAGGFIIVTNPHGPITDLRVGTSSEGLFHFSETVYEYPAAVSNATFYSFSFGDGVSGCIPVPDPAADFITSSGLGVSCGVVSMVVDPGHYQMHVEATLTGAGGNLDFYTPFNGQGGGIGGGATFTYTTTETFLTSSTTAYLAIFVTLDQSLDGLTHTGQLDMHVTITRRS